MGRAGKSGNNSVVIRVLDYNESMQALLKFGSRVHAADDKMVSDCPNYWNIDLTYIGSGLSIKGDGIYSRNEKVAEFCEHERHETS